jgi:hypothetical protein
MKLACWQHSHGCYMHQHLQHEGVPPAQQQSTQVEYSSENASHALRDPCNYVSLLPLLCCHLHCSAAASPVLTRGRGRQQRLCGRCAEGTWPVAVTQQMGCSMIPWFSCRYVDYAAPASSSCAAVHALYFHWVDATPRITFAYLSCRACRVCLTAAVG